MILFSRKEINFRVRSGGERVSPVESIRTESIHWIRDGEVSAKNSVGLDSANTDARTTHTFFGGDYVSITKDDPTEWSVLRPGIFEVIMEFFTSDQQEPYPGLEGTFSRSKQRRNCCYSWPEWSWKVNYHCAATTFLHSSCRVCHSGQRRRYTSDSKVNQEAHRCGGTRTRTF